MAILEYRAQFPDLDITRRTEQIQQRQGGEDTLESFTFFIYADVTPAADDVLRFLLVLPRHELWSIRRIAIGIEGAGFYDGFPLLRSRYFQIFSEAPAPTLLKEDFPLGPNKAYTGGVATGLVTWEKDELHQADLPETAEIGFEVVSTGAVYVDYGRLVIQTIRTPMREVLRETFKKERLSIRNIWERLWTGGLTRRRG